MARKILLVLLLSLLPLVLLFFPLPAHAIFVIVVNSHSDVINPGDNLCTLREAVRAVNTHSPSGAGGSECQGAPGIDTVVLAAGTYTLTLPGTHENDAATGDLDIKQDVTIQGNGFGCLLNPTCTSINGNTIDRVFDITTTAHVTITKLDIVLGRADGPGGGIYNRGVLALRDVYLSNNSTCVTFCDGGGLYNASGAIAALDTVGFVLNHATHYGGAIYNDGTVTLTNNLFTFDSADGGGGLYNVGTATLSDTTIAYETSVGFGGAIYNGNSLTLNRVTLDHNQAGGGGGIDSSGAMTLTNVTLSANSAVSVTSGGGAFFNQGSGIATLTNVSVVSNTAPSGGGFINNGGTLSLGNSIVAYNSGGNCWISPITSLGYNIDSANTCALSATGDITNTDPLLGPLANNGGTTFTHALLPGSPAINKIPFGTNGCGTTITTDQRGASRPIGSSCDIGAYEAAYLFLPLILK